jgi:hypothetical protein
MMDIIYFSLCAIGMLLLMGGAFVYFAYRQVKDLFDNE